MSAFHEVSDPRSWIFTTPRHAARPFEIPFFNVTRQGNFIAKSNGGDEANIFGNVISLLVHEFPCGPVN
jgi:hypothetical protein